MSLPLRNLPSIQAGADHVYQSDELPPQGYYKSKPVSYKDSISHPINVSWIIPAWISALLQEDMTVPRQQPLVAFAQREADAMQRMDATDAITRAQAMYPNWRPRGNLGLSSCPGKKVRLDGPVNGRAKIVRDLDLDFDRLEKLGFTRVVCCLFDEELELLGSPFPQYLEAANNHGLDVVSLPDSPIMASSSSPSSPSSSICRCVGRAAVVACCWLLRLRYFNDHREVIEWVRAQRSPKAIETREQAQFVMGYQLWTLGGAARESSIVYENEIKRRIDWSESNMAKARADAALMNERGHGNPSQKHQHGSQQPSNHPNPQALKVEAERKDKDDEDTLSSSSSNSSIPSTATVSSRQKVPVPSSSLSGTQRSTTSDSQSRS
ncbi:hypothetical protein BGZ75_009516 [Mortierella antarctica]|nr:hypothetical protein BGZ75_009516 [Mortierella antarctica]